MPGQSERAHLVPLESSKGAASSTPGRSQEWWAPARRRLSRRVLLAVAVAVILAVLVGTLVPLLEPDKAPGHFSPQGFSQAVAAADTRAMLAALEDAAAAGARARGAGSAKEEAEAATRAVGTEGYARSVEYVVDQLRGGEHWLQTRLINFTTPVWRTQGDPVLNLYFTAAASAPLQLDLNVDFAAMRYSGAGSAPRAPLLALSSPQDACNASAYAAAAGAVVLMPETAPCTLYNASLLAEDANATGVLVFRTAGAGIPITRIRNNVWLPGDRFVRIPVFGVTRVLGQLLLAAAGEAEASLALNATSEVIPCTSVVAETTHGRDDAVIAVGAHLDSVIAGPGINDDGTGTVAVLSMAKAIVQHEIRPANRLRFFWWGAEEEGLIGSRSYIRDLEADDPEALAELRAYINLDMLGSPNFVVGVYDGDTAPPGARNGSKAIEKLFHSYFDAQGVKYASLALSTTGGSDYFGFMHAGIPVGALATGAGSIKSPEEQAVFGGSANAPYDSCYHQSCDTVNNVDHWVLKKHMTAAAYVLMQLGQSKSLAILN